MSRRKRVSKRKKRTKSDRRTKVSRRSKIRRRSKGRRSKSRRSKYKTRQGGADQRSLCKTQEWLQESQSAPPTFIKEELLGDGKSGEVYLAHVKGDEGRKYAIKVAPNVVGSGKESFIRERNILEALNQGKGNPFIVQMYYAFHTANELCIVLEHIPCGEFYYLNKHQPRKNTPACIFYSAQIVLALQHIHMLGYVHGDLKPENIVLNCNGYIKLIDFGLSQLANSEDSAQYQYCCLRAIQGTPEYMAPEIVKIARGSTEQRYGTSVDMWALGIVIYELLFGLPPFLSTRDQLAALKPVALTERARAEGVGEAAVEGALAADEPKAALIELIVAHLGDQPGEIERQILEDDHDLSHKVFNSYSFQRGEAGPDSTRTLINKLLHKEQKRRLTDTELVGHEFFSIIDWERLEIFDYDPPFNPLGSEGYEYRKLVKSERRPSDSEGDVQPMLCGGCGFKDFYSPPEEGTKDKKEDFSAPWERPWRRWEAALAEDRRPKKKKKKRMMRRLTAGGGKGFQKERSGQNLIEEQKLVDVQRVDVQRVGEEKDFVQKDQKEKFK